MLTLFLNLIALGNVSNLTALSKDLYENVKIEINKKLDEIAVFLNSLSPNLIEFIRISFTKKRELSKTEIKIFNKKTNEIKTKYVFKAFTTLPKKVQLEFYNTQIHKLFNSKSFMNLIL